METSEIRKGRNFLSKDTGINTKKMPVSVLSPLNSHSWGSIGGVLAQDLLLLMTCVLQLHSESLLKVTVDWTPALDYCVPIFNLRAAGVSIKSVASRLIFKEICQVPNPEVENHYLLSTLKSCPSQIIWLSFPCFLPLILTKQLLVTKPFEKVFWLFCHICIFLFSDYKLLFFLTFKIKYSK